MPPYTVIDPATGTQHLRQDETSATALETAIADADAEFRGWGRERSIDERASVLRDVARLHRERRQELARIIVREMGKVLEGALGEVDFAADIIDYYADNAHAILADRPLAIQGEGTAVIRRSALGPLLGIMPWNFPYYQVARFAAPNILIGNPILLKHAPQCPESSAAIETIFRDAGLPAGMYTNLYVSDEQAADIIADPRVQGVSLTGSERAGASVAETAGRHLKKVVLELGGSDPFLLFSTDDMDAVVRSAVDARLDNSGQSCNAAKRFIILDALYDEFLHRFVAHMGAHAAQDPMAEGVVLGPLSSLSAAEALDAQVTRAVDDGARLVLGGYRSGAFFEPTVLTEITPQMAAWGEEFFGPVASVYRAADEADAIRIANGTGFGLGSYVFTTDPAQAARVADRIEAGMVYINLVLADSPELPFGGVKRSGIGRELGFLGADEFVNKKLIRTA